jgi:type II secretory ATPase GspE/PulE/Tfp pilus assembly ATPase PilB-like protein
MTDLPPGSPGVAAEIPQTDVANVPAEEAMDRLVARAAAMGASDLFVNAYDDRYVVEVRHLGVVRQIATLTRDQGKRAIAYVKNNAGMTGGDVRQPDEGRWIWSPEGEATPGIEGVDLRVSVIPTLYGEDAAFRLFSRDAHLHDLNNLGMFEKQLSKYRRMINNPGGIVLITGPTGSGKTATLYATLMSLNDGSRKINTIEDPVEFSVEGLRQSGVNADINLDFADLLRAVLRQNPDIIMVGEIRDQKTAQVAVRAANSGILVLATLHAQSTAGAIQSMRAFDIPDHFIAGGLRGVVAQRLVRTLDPQTRREMDLGTEAFEDIKDLLGPDEGKTLYAPVPAESNHMSGYIGRSGVFEIMEVTPSLRTLIASNARPAELRQQAIKDGMLEFRKAALLKVARGQTSTEEVFRTIPGEELLIDG